MDERLLPPLVEGEQQGRLDMILARPSLFPPLHLDQTLVFTFRWWGDIQPCIIKLPPDKTEARYSFTVTCGSVSFRQYLYDAHSLRFAIEVLGGEIVSDASKGSEVKKDSPKRGTPREVLMRRQARLKKGWQHGDIVGSFVVMDLRLNARAEFLHEAKIVDEFGDIVGSIVMTLFYHEGTVQDFRILNLIKEEQEAKEKEEENKQRISSLPWSKSPNLKGKQANEVSFANRPSSMKEPSRDSPRRKYSTKAFAKLSSKKDIQDKENQSPLRDKLNTPENVTSSSKSYEMREDKMIRQEMREDKMIRRDEMREDKTIRPRPSSWSHCSPLDGVDPYELVESGALRAEDLPALLQVLEGKSPNIDMKLLDPETRQLLSRIDLSMSFSGINIDSSGMGVYGDTEADIGKTALRKKQGYSLMKGRSVDGTDTSGFSLTSGIWPLEEKQDQNKNIMDVDDYNQSEDILSERRAGTFGKATYDSPRRSPRPNRGSSHPPSLKPSGSNKRDAKGTVHHDILGMKDVFRKVSPLKDPSSIKPSGNDKQEVKGTVLDDETGMKAVYSKADPIKDTVNEEESSVLVVDIETLSLVSPFLQRKQVNKDEKSTSSRHMNKGSHILQRSRMCYLINLEVQTGSVLPPEWECSHTCASRKVQDHEVKYNVRQVLKLPPVSSLEVLRSELVIRCVSRRLGQKENVEIGRATVSVMDLWRLSGSQITIPLQKPHLGNLDPPGRSLLSVDNTENLGERPCITITARLGLAVGHASMHSFMKEETLSHSLEREISDIDRLSDKGIDPFSKDKKGIKHSMSMTWGQQDSIEMTDDDIKLYEVSEKSEKSILDELEPNENPKLCRPQPQTHEIHKPLGSDVFNSLCITDRSINNSTDLTERSYVSNTSSHGESIHNSSNSTDGSYISKASGHVEVVDSFLGTPMETRVMVSSIDRDNSSFHYTKSNHITPHNEKHKPLSHNSERSDASNSSRNLAANQWLGEYTNKYQESLRDLCHVHLEVIKGRNLPWVADVKHNEPRPPCSYVKTIIGGIPLHTNICVQEENPTWNFAADVQLPYSQLNETGGNLILKVFHSRSSELTSEDPLLGFVCVDATSIWSGHVSLCGWYPVLDLRGAVRGHVKVSLTPHEPPTSFSSPHLSFLESNCQIPSNSHSSSAQCRSFQISADSYPYQPQTSDAESRSFHRLLSHEYEGYGNQITSDYTRQTDSPNSLARNISSHSYDDNTRHKEDSITSSVYSNSSRNSSQSVLIEPNTLNEAVVSKNSIVPSKHSSLPVSPRPEESQKRISPKPSGIPRSRSYSASSGSPSKSSYVKAKTPQKTLVTRSSNNSCTNSFMQKPCNPLSRISSYINSSSAVVGQSCSSQSYSPRTAVRSTSFSQLSDHNVASAQHESHIPVISQQPHKTQHRTRSSSFTTATTHKETYPNSKKRVNGPTSRDLPNIPYQDKTMNTIVNQGYIKDQDQNQTKKNDSVTLKQSLTNESSKVGKYPYETNTKSEFEKSHLPVRTGSILLKDSLIVSHFRMMDEEQTKELSKSSNILSGISAPKGKSLIGEQESSSSSYGSSDEKDVENKPMSCLRTPGSPSMRAKRVTFAQHLISEASTTSRPASPFTKFPAVTTLISEASSTPRTASTFKKPPNVATFSSYMSNEQNNLQKEYREPHDQSTLLRTHYDKDDYNVNELSDLQVVPCREGDTQGVDIAGNSGQCKSGKSNTTSTLTNTTSTTELIMRYSWMNQMSRADTPCVSFIETKVLSGDAGKSKTEPFFLHEDAEKDLGTLESPDATGVSNLLQKTRRLRNRLAANFNIQ